MTGQKMKYKTMIATVAIVLGLAVPAAAQYGGVTGPAKADDTVPGGSDASSHPNEGPPDPEGAAEDLRMKGECDKAIPIFRRLANYGAGFELAQYNLGLCLLDIAKTESDAARATSLRQEAATDIIAAADRGLPKAQASLVTMYLDGNGVERDPVQAGMWALLYHANGARMAIGMPNISPALQARLDSALNDQAWQQAQTRADAWTPHS
jgi:TPR repeat protein